MQTLQQIGKSTLNHIYEFADVYHCLPLAGAADEVIEDMKIPEGNFDNVASAQLEVPRVTLIGKVYAKAIEDVVDVTVGTPYDCLLKLLASPAFALLEDYSNPTHAQSQQYIAALFSTAEHGTL